MTQRPWAGTDVSGTRLDVDLFPASQPTSFAYADQGLADLQAWLAQRPVTGIVHFAATISGEPAPPRQLDRAAVDEPVKLRQMTSQHHVALTNAGRLTRTAEARALLTGQIKAVKAAIDQAADDIEVAAKRSERLREVSELVRSMPGVGQIQPRL